MLPHLYHVLFICRLSESGIFSLVKSDRASNLLYRKYLSMPLIPAKMIVERARGLRSEIKLNLQPKFRKPFRQFHRYFKRYWLKKVRPERISVFGKQRRTNNGLEHLHAQMSKRLSTHSKFFKFMDDVERHIFIPAMAKIMQTRNDAGRMSVQTVSQRERET
jgi:hypothetical protein